MEESKSPRKNTSEPFGKNSFRRNPYKSLHEASPSKKQIDKSPRRKQLGENSPSKKPDKLTDGSPRKTQNKLLHSESPRKENKLHDDSPRKRQNKPSHNSPKKKQSDNESRRPPNEPFPHAIPRIQLEDRNHWVFPSELSNEPDIAENNVKPKKKHRLIQEYDPDLHGAEFERTLVLVKPNAIAKAKSIEVVIKRHGLLLLKKKRAYLKPDQVRDFYLQSLDEEDNKYYRIYRELVASEGQTQQLPADLRLDGSQKTVETSSTMDEYLDFMTSGPVEVMIVAGRGAVCRWRHLMGPEDPRQARATHPKTVRARLGGESVLRNGVYGSSSPEQAEKEIRFFFPDTREDIGKGESSEYLSKTVNPVLLKGLIQLCRQKPDNPLVWLADWLLANNPHAKS